MSETTSSGAKKRWYEHILRHDIIEVVVDWLVTNVENTVVRLLPVAAPLLSIFAIHRALVAGGWGAQAYWAGFIMEMTGLAAGILSGLIATNNVLRPDAKQDPRIGDEAFNYYMVIVVICLVVYEVMPAVVGVYLGTVGTQEFFASLVPVTFPFVSVIANRVIKVIGHIRRLEQREESKEKKAEEREDRMLAIEIAERMATFQQKLRHADDRFQATLEAKGVKPGGKQRVETAANSMVETAVNGDADGDGKAGVNERDLMIKMLEIYGKDSTASARKVGGLIGVSHTTVRQLLNNLSALDVVHVKSLGPGKGNLVTLNGKHEEFLRGEI